MHSAMNSLWIVLNVFVGNVLTSESCKCGPLSSCPALEGFITDPPRSSLKKVKSLICGIDEEVRVCCDEDVIKDLKKESKVPYSNEGTCGLQDSSYEFPWMVAFVAFGRSLCTGVLLNERYVLTSATCATQCNETPEFFTLIMGDFEVKNDSCIATNTVGSDCFDVQSFSIEEAISHPLYNGTFSNIGLIRLNRNAVYTDYVSPICLPKRKLDTETALYTSRFVKHSDQHTNKEKYKKTGTTTLESLDTCRETYKKHKRITVTKFNFCSMDDINERVPINTFIESGGAVVSVHDNQWQVDGVLSLTVDIGARKSPVVNTYVSYYLSWIQGNMKS